MPSKVENSNRGLACFTSDFRWPVSQVKFVVKLQVSDTCNSTTKITGVTNLSNNVKQDPGFENKLWIWTSHSDLTNTSINKVRSNVLTN